MKIGITGMSGSGKSTFINQIPASLNFFLLPEVARGFITQKDMFENGGYDLALNSICVSNWHNIQIMNANTQHNFISDRTFLDDFALMHLYFKKNLSLEKIQENINLINKESGSDFIYDHLFIIQNSEDEDFLNANVFNDKQRNNSVEYEGYLETAKNFYKYVNQAIAELDGVCKQLHILEFGDLDNDYLEKLMEL
jgi:deoxyadenosine/deoxycytidine kinase